MGKLGPMWGSNVEDIGNENMREQDDKAGRRAEMECNQCDIVIGRAIVVLERSLVL